MSATIIYLMANIVWSVAVCFIAVNKIDDAFRRGYALGKEHGLMVARAGASHQEKEGS